MSIELGNTNIAFIQYWKSSKGPERKRFVFESGLSESYIRQHLVQPDPSKRKTPTMPTLLKLMRASHYRLDLDELIYYFYTEKAEFVITEAYNEDLSNNQYNARNAFNEYEPETA